MVKTGRMQKMEESQESKKERDFREGMVHGAKCYSDTSKKGSE
jgi:hypothetical protein